MLTNAPFSALPFASRDCSFATEEPSRPPPVRLDDFPFPGTLEHAVFYICDRDGRITHSNRAYMELAAELGGVTMGDVTPSFPLAAGALRAIVRKIEDWKAPVIREEMFVLGGEPRPYRSIHLGLYDGGNRLTGVAGVYQDAAVETGGRTLPGASLARLRERFDDITQLATDWIWETDRLFKLTYLSPRVTDTLGFLPRELEGRNLLEIGFLGQPGARSLDLETPFRDKLYRIGDRNGRWRSFMLSGLPYYCANTGACLGLRGTAREVETRAGLGVGSSVADRGQDPELARDLAYALDRNQMHLCFHPLIDLSSGRVSGVEALLRWTHPERGEVPPDLFIPIAEATGAIGVLGEWVLRSACRQAKKWRQAGLPPIRIGVNLSPAQFHHHDLVGVVRRALFDADLAPQWLEIEITEGMIVDDVDHVVDTLKALRELGVHLAIDDFGTGYSSLAYLQRLPVNRVKIDRGFIDGIRSNPANAAITRAIIALAHELGMTVIAEGVETQDQFDHLRNEGCDEAQGFYFTRPLRAAEMAGWLYARACAPAFLCLLESRHAQQVAGDNQLLNLRRSVRDRHHPRVAKVPFHR